MRFIILLAVLMILLLQAIAPAGIDLPLDAVGRLYAAGRICTAFAIVSSTRQESGQVYYLNLVATAGHCVEGLRPQDIEYEQPEVHVRFGEYGQFEAVYPKARRPVLWVAAMSGLQEIGGYDIALLVIATPYRIPTITPDFDTVPRPGSSLLSIGYPAGALTVRTGKLVGYDSTGNMIVEGVASPGSSGGPVLIPGTRRAVGIVILSTTPDGWGNPYACLIARCRSVSPYMAVPITKLAGLIDWGRWREDSITPAR